MTGGQSRRWLDLVLLHIVTSCCWSMRYFDVTKHERGKEFFHKFRTQTQIQYTILFKSISKIENDEKWEIRNLFIYLSIICKHYISEL